MGGGAQPSGIEAMKDQYGEVSFKRAGAVALLEIDRPPVNFVSVELMRSLADALEDVDAESSLRSVVLASAGKAFCAGADLASPAGVGGAGRHVRGAGRGRGVRARRGSLP